MMPEKLDSSIVLLRERIEQGMRGSADLILDEFELAGVKGLAFMFDGLVSNTQVSDFLLRPINRMAPPEATRKSCGSTCAHSFYSAASRASWRPTRISLPRR